MGKGYKTMLGREIDMDKLIGANELMPAIGNVRVNARGDELGHGGKIVKKREEVMSEYYETKSAKKSIPTSGIVQTKEEKNIESHKLQQKKSKFLDDEE